MISDLLNQAFCIYVNIVIVTYTLYPLPPTKMVGAPQVFWGSGENGYFVSGSWGALVIIFRELGSKLIILGI